MERLFKAKQGSQRRDDMGNLPAKTHSNLNPKQAGQLSTPHFLTTLHKLLTANRELITENWELSFENCQEIFVT
ncbi:hypothetical protein D3A96_07175 [Robertkochia marina]|nr:hypothetical protein D3A96_07175 [Robertkochia marina]